VSDYENSTSEVGTTKTLNFIGFLGDFASMAEQIELVLECWLPWVRTILG